MSYYDERVEDVFEAAQQEIAEIPPGGVPLKTILEVAKGIKRVDAWLRSEVERWRILRRELGASDAICFREENIPALIDELGRACETLVAAVMIDGPLAKLEALTNRVEREMSDETSDQSGPISFGDWNQRFGCTAEEDMHWATTVRRGIEIIFPVPRDFTSEEFWQVFRDSHDRDRLLGQVLEVRALINEIADRALRHGTED